MAVGALAALSVAASFAASDGAAKRAFSVRDVGRMRGVHHVQMSPDGHHVAYTVSSAAGTAVQFVAITGGTPTTVVEADGGSPLWRPDGGGLGFLSPGDEKDSGSPKQVWVQPITGGARSRLTDMTGGVREFAWSPDEERLALVVPGEGDVVHPRSGTGEKIYTGTPADFDYLDADLRRVLLNFADITALGVIVDPDVEGRVTMRAKEVAWDEALAGILESHQLGYVLKGTTLRVATKKRLVREAQERRNAEPWTPSRRPLAIDSPDFKHEGVGYRRHRDSTQIVVYDLARRAAFWLTSGPYEHTSVTWSPEGRYLAFVSNGPTRDGADDAGRARVFVTEAQSGAKAVPVDTREGQGQFGPVWSPVGDRLAFHTPQRPDSAIGQIVVVEHPAARDPSSLIGLSVLGTDLDRRLSAPSFSADGRWVYLLVEDRGATHVLRIPTGGGQPERMISGDRDVSSYDVGRGGEVVFVESLPSRPPEVSLLRDGKVRRLTGVHEEMAKGIEFAPVRKTQARSGDGTSVDVFVTTPPGKEARKLPAVLWLHGGPVAQDSFGFNEAWQVLAAKGYAVIAPNPRGSSGYGVAFETAINGDWGSKDADDALAALDHVVTLGIADPDRLAVGGWSYGGYLTNVLVTKTDRFKAAVSGASTANLLAAYGVDDTFGKWEMLAGMPWRAPEAWIRQSPFFRVENVKTPVLVMCGIDDVRTPVSQSEQWFTALRRTGKEATLVLYPGEGHPAFGEAGEVDQWQRTLGWLAKYLR